MTEGGGGHKKGPQKLFMKVPFNFDCQLISRVFDELCTLVMAHLENTCAVDVDDKVSVPKSGVVSYRVECYLKMSTFINKTLQLLFTIKIFCLGSTSVVYFDQLLGAARTQKLVETFFSAVF